MLKTTQLIRTIINFLLVCSLALIFSACTSSGTEIKTMPEPGKTSSESGSIPEPTKENEEIFTFSEIPKEVQNKMWGVTIHDSSLLDFDDLSYLTLTYYGYDGKAHTGNMIVEKELAEEVTEIFRELYEIKFPIKKMILPCEYDGVDELSMRDNNTSAYNDRPIEGNNSTSYHQLGRAIDINPLVNPYIRFSDGEVLPKTAHKYLDRTLDVQGMIKADSECVKIFEKYGWTWGGTWNSVKDYQHFEKK